MHIVLAGDALLAPSIVRRMMDDFVSRPMPTSESPQRVKDLTEREREVLVALSRGQSNTEIAAEMFLSAATSRPTWRGS